VGISRKGVGVHLFYWFGAARFVIRHPTDVFLYADNNAVMHLDSSFELEPLSPVTSTTSVGGEVLHDGAPD
jgi:lipopolysaccharide transport system ATP-binding protein